MASIVTRKSSFAVVHMITANGVRKQKWETYHTLPEAVRRKEQLELYHDLRKSKKIGGEVETVAQLMSVYLRLHGVPRWSPSTYQSNRGLIQHYILPCMGNMRLSELSPRTVAMLYSRMLEEPRISFPYHKQGGQKLSPTTLRSIHKVLHSAFEQAVLWEYVDRNPFHRVPLPVCRTKQKTFLTPEQIKRLVLYCSPTLALAIPPHLCCFASKGGTAGSDLAGTLTSPGTPFALTRRWPGLAGMPSIRSTDGRSCTASRRWGGRQRTVLVLKQPKTESSARTVYLPPSLMALLKQSRPASWETGGLPFPHLIFAYPDGRPMQECTLTKQFQLALKEAGLPKVTFHSLRYSSISYKLSLSGRRHQGGTAGFRPCSGGYDHRTLWTGAGAKPLGSGGAF